MSGCLIDTAIKDGRGLLSWLGADALAELVAEAHAAGLEIALAGELRAEDLPTVRATGADIAGVRSAACRDGRRTARARPRAHRAAAGAVRVQRRSALWRVESAPRCRARRRRPDCTRRRDARPAIHRRVPAVRPVSSSSASRAGSRPPITHVSTPAARQRGGQMLVDAARAAARRARRR